MDNLTNIMKILGILAALITLRFVVQAVIRRPGSGGFLKGLLPFALPPLITGGPAFIAMPASLYALLDPSAPALLALMAWAGGVMLAIGLAAMFGMLTRQQTEILRLGELLASREAEDSAGKP